MMTEDASLGVAEWLRALHLDQYTELFEKNDFWRLSDCRSISDEALIEIGVNLQGHRKRILCSLQKSLWEDPSAMEEVGPRPVPMKRNIFRTSTEGPRVIPSPSREAEVRDDTMSFAVQKTLAVTERGSPPRLNQAPPPIPPRLGCRPPMKFSSGSPPSSSEHFPAPINSQRESAAPALGSPALSAALDSAAEGGPSPREGDLEEKTKPVLPPLPVKSHRPEKRSTRGAPPPLPIRPPVLPPRALHAKRFGSLSAEEEEPPNAEPPPVLVTRAKPQPRILPPRLRPPAPEFDQPDYEDVVQAPLAPGESMVDKVGIEEESAILRGKRSARLDSLISDDDMIGDDSEDYEDVAANDGWNEQGLSTLQPGRSRVSSGTMDGADASIANSPVIKSGWLDKNPPQGSYIYQRRWVRLDTDYLRYFDSEKDMYSKRFIPVTSISRVSSIGDQKFEVITYNRNFVFRAESDSDRNNWVRVLQQVMEERRLKALDRFSMIQMWANGMDGAEKAGPLELRGCKPKLYVTVAGDKVFLYKSFEDFRLGIGITFIEMNLGNVKDMDRRAFDLTTPYRTFSFLADSDSEKEEWVMAMQQSIVEALSNSEVAEQIWSVESNRICADCCSPKPDWASVNLCVVFCKRCAGEHRSLGPNISKVRSLKMDRKVWTEDLIQLFQRFGNAVGNQFWAANVPPSEAINATSTSQERRQFITAKYKEGKYRRYHPLFGNQEELNKALCAAVTTSDLAETQSLVFCGAEVGCFSGDPAHPSPLALAEEAGQRLQTEFLLQNRNSGESLSWSPGIAGREGTGTERQEIPRVELKSNMDKQYYVARLSIMHNGYLHKTASMSKAVNERKSREEFSRRWCVLNDGVLSYYESDRNSAPNGEIKMTEIVCLAINPPDTHGFVSTFEIYTESERLYLFGLDNPEEAREWISSIAKSFVSNRAEELLDHDYERIGRLQYKGGLNLQRATVGWFALVQSTLYACFEDSEKEEAFHLKKLQELSLQSDNEVLVLVERRRTLYIQGERKLDFLGWISAIQKAAGTSGDTLSGQQLTELDIPVLVDRCIYYITQCGLTSEGIYRKSGQNSKTTSLLDVLRKDARSICLKEGDHQVDDVANTLKRFFREIGEGIFTEHSPDWLNATSIEEEDVKVEQYRSLLSHLPPVNRATLKALINHLYCVQCFSDMNQMNVHNLAIVFGPTLFQTDGKDYKAGRVVEDLITHYVLIFNVDAAELKKQRNEIMAIIKMREAGFNMNKKESGHFICTVYLEEKKPEAEQHVKIPATMTAEELTYEILERRKIVTREKDYWSCFEVNEKEETERPLHYLEKVLPLLHSLGTGSYLVVRKNLSMENMLIYLASKVEDTKHGMMKFHEEKNLRGLVRSAGNFHDRYFILNSSSLRLYKEVRSHRPEREWAVKNLKVYLGIKRKLCPPTCWGFTMVSTNEKKERHLWYFCCDTQMEMRDWLATFLFVQNGGNVWPSEASKTRAPRTHQDSRLGNLSLIPLRGSENEMRNSVAAFAADPLALFRNV
ncbi:arf-GAP with Rho-GAP domain, ANK repeat and PH domain-containing protein 1 isoform X3 [Rhinatrema bivittatum]|uniref:arf-GAP with Rho-GAP domain, ANK repeat and PH domain-containing protein 1 isoform X3 n=1 Tax=Rhinatrema bivittatum TaxID=194408 RepID=UPI00112A82F3|nr:arf-GAP with Rho-GAP domain, ANK repeat and PH domain-containing protein 1 isoform X3 [Rhinatrema bivittatum]